LVTSSNDDFEVEWKDHLDAALTWLPDWIHLPRPVPPLAEEYIRGVRERFSGNRCIFVNGYHYMSRRQSIAEIRSALPPDPRGARQIWQESCLPIVEKLCSDLRSRPYAAMTVQELAASAPQYIREAAEVSNTTHLASAAFMGIGRNLVEFCEKELGADGIGLAIAVLQGSGNESGDSAIALARLAEEASNVPAVATAITEGSYEDIDSIEGGSKFLSHFEDYLTAFGWRSESWFVIHLPTWAERPALALDQVARHIGFGTRLLESHQKAIEARTAAEQDLAQRFSGQGRPSLDTRLIEVNDFSFVSEARAHWQLIGAGSVRVPLLELGRKLAAQTIIDDAEDVFWLYLSEVEALARQLVPMQRLVEPRKKDNARWQSLNPPPYLGTPDREPVTASDALRIELIMGPHGSSARSDSSGTIKGGGASPGTVKGRARVVMTLEEASKLQHGDILVTKATSPSWTPLFATVAGVVSDTGGILSHTAICAREFGIPCVVGTQNGTLQIHDGDLVVLDGTAGTVTVLM
jgi:rifampicin phosphotransferase